MKISGKKLKELIDARFYNVAELARELGVSRETLARKLPEDSVGIKPELFRALLIKLAAAPDELLATGHRPPRAHEFHR